MNRNEVLKELASRCILRRDSNMFSAVVLPSFIEAKRFSRDFYELVAEVPNWLLPSYKKNLNEFKYQLGSIIFVNSSEQLRGRTIQSLYYSDRIATKIKIELYQYIYPTMQRDFSCFIEFKDSLDSYDSNCILQVEESNLILNRDLKVKSYIMNGNLEVASKDLKGRYSWYEAIEACEELGEGWRLPTKDELNELYKNKNTIGGFVEDFYWSSAEYGSSYAVVQYFGDGFHDEDVKEFKHYVCAVRTLTFEL